MAYLLGTDEAGYGPKLGPLVIAATLWHIPDQHLDADLYALLAPDVSPAPASHDDTTLHLADSKQVYQSSRGIERLERGVLALAQHAAASGANFPAVPATWLELLDRWAVDDRADIAADPCLADRDFPLPVATDHARIAAAAATFAAACQPSGLRLLACSCRVITPARFNQLSDQWGNKAHVLTRLTLGLATTLLDRHADLQPARVWCDKHGGRDRYAAALQDACQGDWVDVLEEGPLLSRYHLRSQQRAIEFRFQPRGERLLPIAVASMIAKYCRELAMRPFNAFWARHVPGIRPTAGYATDAARFRREISATQACLGIADHLLWRAR